MRTDRVRYGGAQRPVDISLRATLVTMYRRSPATAAFLAETSPSATAPSQPSYSEKQQRLHGLDALRAFLMLLGIVYHALSAFQPPGLHIYGIQDTQTSVIPLWLRGFSHSFRMPAFFLLAGFFARMTYERAGLEELLRNRIVRVWLPLIAGWFILLPPSHAARFYFANRNQPDAGTRTMEYVFSGAWQSASVIHLWFLFYLAVITFIFAICHTAALRLGLGKYIVETQRLFARQSGAVPSAWIAGVCLVPFLLAQHGVGIGTPRYFDVSARILSIYCIYFGSGWLLFSCTERLVAFKKGAWSCIGLAVLIGVSAKWISLDLAKDDAALIRAISRCAAAFIGPLMTVGLIGLALRYFTAASVRVRYISDSSYWLYLSHLPVTMWLHVWMAPLPWHWVVKVALNVLITTGILLCMYHVCIRYTFIGTVLNGRRHKTLQ